MNSIVVQDDVDAFGVWVMLRKFFQELNEKRGVFLCRSCPHNRAIASVQSSGNVGFLVFSGRDHQALMTSGHPVQANLGVEVDIGFVFVERQFVGRKLSNQTSNLGKASVLLPQRQWAQHDGFRIATACTHAAQYPSHHANADFHPGAGLHHKYKQLAGPSGTGVPIVQWAPPKHFGNDLLKSGSSFGVAIHDATIQKTLTVSGLKSMHPSRNRGSNALKFLCNRTESRALAQHFLYCQCPRQKSRIPNSVTLLEPLVCWNLASFRCIKTIGSRIIAREARR